MIVKSCFSSDIGRQVKKYMRICELLLNSTSWNLASQSSLLDTMGALINWLQERSLMRRKPIQK